MNRRNVLRKTATTGVVVLAGITSATGSASAGHIQLYDTVEVDAFSSVETWSDCCTASLECEEGSRSPGEKGDAVDFCELNSYTTFVMVRWFDSTGDKAVTSWVDHDDLAVVD